MLLLVLVFGGVLFLAALGFLVRSCTSSFRSAHPEQNDSASAENQPARSPASAASSPLPFGAGPVSGLAPRLGRSLIEKPDIASSADAGTHALPPEPVDERARALEIRRNLAEKDKLKALERRP